MKTAAALVVALTMCGSSSPARAQPVFVEADLTGGYTSDQANALATQVRVFGDIPLGLRVLAEAAWAARSETNESTDAFGAAYLYSNRLQIIEAYAERLFHQGPAFAGFRAGRYRTPFGIYTRSDYAYSGFLRAPLRVPAGPQGKNRHRRYEPGSIGRSAVFPIKPSWPSTSSCFS